MRALRGYIMKIKTAHKPPQTTSVFSILTLVVFVLSTIALFNNFDNPLIPILFAAFGVVIFIVSINKDHKRQSEAEGEYTVLLNKNFCCPKCKHEIKDEIEHEDIDGLPLLYLCKDCDVLWFTGNHVRST